MVAVSQEVQQQSNLQLVMFNSLYKVLHPSPEAGKSKLYKEMLKNHSKAIFPPVISNSTLCLVMLLQQQWF